MKKFLAIILMALPMVAASTALAAEETGDWQNDLQITQSCLPMKHCRVTVINSSRVTDYSNIRAEMLYKKDDWTVSRETVPLQFKDTIKAGSQQTWTIGLLFGDTKKRNLDISLLGADALNPPKAKKARPQPSLEKQKAEASALVTSFMEKMVQDPSAAVSEKLMPYVSADYFRANGLNQADYKVNNIAPTEFSIKGVELPYVEVRAAKPKVFVHTLKFKVVREGGKLHLRPSAISGKYVTAWWEIRQFVKE